MKLAEHVDKLRDLIESAFDKHFARLGLSKLKQMDIEKLPEDIRPKRLRFEEMLKNHIGETGDYEHGREKLIDELTFTLFNRLAAVKVMESASLFPPIINKDPEHGDRSFGHKAWLELNPHMRSEELEGIREYIKSAFDELGITLPLYSRNYSYALLPDAISLNEIIDAFNELEKDSQVEKDIWHSDDVLGWMYESYNNQKKLAHKESKAKTEYNKVSLQSQVYTPRWVVQFLVENSLGKLYLEMYPDSEIKKRYKIANAPKTQEREPKPLHEIKTIDPACGSGNFLLYSFDFFYELYIDQIENYGAEYDEKDIPKLIIENNIHGIDLDDRAIQLAQLGLFIKAKKKNRSVGELIFKVVSSDFYLPEYEQVDHIFSNGSDLNLNQKSFIAEIWNDLKYAYKFGSLIHVNERITDKFKDEKENARKGDLFAYTEKKDHEDFATTFFSNLKTAVEKYAQAQGNTFLASKTRDAITFLELITTKYDVATANPPYTDSSDFGSELKEFIEKNYKKPYKFHTNLYATFIKRCYELTGEDGKIAMVHPPTFMYIKTFEGVRKFIIEKTGIDLFIEWGYLGMFHQSARVDAAMYVLDKKRKDRDATFIKLNHIYEGKRYEAFVEAYDYLIEGRDFVNNYTIPQSKLKIIKSWPFIYWISDEFREKFGESNLDSLASVKTGISSGNNERFSRHWWEVDKNSISIDYQKDRKKWVLFLKGGSYEKWFGNIYLVLNWENEGYEIKHYVNSKGKLKSRPQNISYFFKEGVSTVKATAKGGDFRYTPPNTIFADGAPSVFFDKQLKSIWFGLAVLNSPLSRYSVNCLNPTVNTQIGDLKRLPFVIPDENIVVSIEIMAIKNVEIKKKLCSFNIYDPLFTGSSISRFKTAIPTISINVFLNYENHLLTQIFLNEAIINEKVFEIYNLTEQDKAMVLEKEGESIGGLPVSSVARTAYLAESEATTEFPLDTIRVFIKALPVKEFTVEEQDTIESGFPTLYQSHNNLEEFCIRNKVNPINIWYWFKQSNVIPQQRMHTLAMEFLVDMIREVLMEDEDGIIPLVPNAGEKILLDRIEDKFREKEFSSAQYSSFDSILGRPIQEYLNKYFFAELSDHLNLFQYLPKTPFIWHLSSGLEQGFDCYIIIYKWSRDKLMRLRSVYIEHRERSLVNRQSDLSGNDSADAQNEKDKIFRQLQEIEEFKGKIDELLSEGYNPILDDGVGKNIAPLQQKKMITYDVLNAGQLKKYLNADW
ncbi:MAG: restriction endonuclease [Spirochaetaceae bacterium 4572_7]|nr:MAG: restriction endonuclease [Spirochaetaceae bacterium 4572_7]